MTQLAPPAAASAEHVGGMNGLASVSTARKVTALSAQTAKPLLHPEWPSRGQLRRLHELGLSSAGH